MKDGYLGLALLGTAIVAGGLIAWRRGAPPVLSVDGGFYQRALDQFGGRAVSPAPYEETVSGLQEFLNDCGVGRRFSAAQASQPNNPGLAHANGYVNFLPPKAWWFRTAALLQLANYVTTNVLDDVTLRNHWRPEPYNSMVGGEAGSAHIDGRAIDIDFDYADDRLVAENVLRDLQYRHAWLKMGLGLGPRTIHIDILTGKSSRPNIWCYDGYLHCNRTVGR